MKPMPDLDPWQRYARELSARKLILATRQLAGYLDVSTTTLHVIITESYGETAVKASDWV